MQISERPQKYTRPDLSTSNNNVFIIHHNISIQLEEVPIFSSSAPLQLLSNLFHLARKRNRKISFPVPCLPDPCWRQGPLNCHPILWPRPPSPDRSTPTQVQSHSLLTAQRAAFTSLTLFDTFHQALLPGSVFDPPDKKSLEGRNHG